MKNVLRRPGWIALSNVWLPLLVLASCGGEEDRSVEPTVRDSAGIRIVEYPGPLPHGPELAVGDEPELRHGHRDGDYLFQRIVDGALRPDGGVLMTTRGFRPPATPGWVPGTLVRFDLDTGVADSVAGYDLALWRGAEGAADPFPPGGVVTVSDDRFVVGRTDVPELRWRTLRGELSQIVRWETEGRRPTDEDLAAFRTLLRDDLTRLNSDLEGRRLEGLVERELERYSTLPDEPLPIFGTLVGDGAGGVWVGEYVVGAPRTPVPRYDVVSADGRVPGSVALPENLRVLDLEDDRLLGVLTDELGVESLAVFSVTLPGGG